jgi:hypothetical protein
MDGYKHFTQLNIRKKYVKMLQNLNELRNRASYLHFHPSFPMLLCFQKRSPLIINANQRSRTPLQEVVLYLEDIEREVAIYCLVVLSLVSIPTLYIVH